MVRRVLAVLFPIAAIAVFLLCRAPAAVPSMPAGHMEDLGIVLSVENDELYILAVNQKSAAHRGGVNPGDRLTAINGIAVSGSTIVEDVLKQCVPGDAVELTLERNGITLQISLLPQ